MEREGGEGGEKKLHIDLQGFRGLTVHPMGLNLQV